MEIILIGANNPETIRVINAMKRVIPNFKVRGFLDNDPNKIGNDFYGIPILSGTKNLEKELIDNCFFVNLITRDMLTRYQTSKEVALQNGRFTNLIFPTINLELTKIGTGNYVQEGVVLQAGVELGNNSSIHIGAMIGHETIVGNSAFIAHGCNLSGFTKVEDGVFMGAGVTTVPRITIGRWSVIGAGAVLTKDVPPYSVVVGNPGRIIKTIDPVYENGDIFNA